MYPEIKGLLCIVPGAVCPEIFLEPVFCCPHNSLFQVHIILFWDIPLHIGEDLFPCPAIDEFRLHYRRTDVEIAPCPSFGGRTTRDVGGGQVGHHKSHHADSGLVRYYLGYGDPYVKNIGALFIDYRIGASYVLEEGLVEVVCQGL